MTLFYHTIYRHGIVIGYEIGRDSDHALSRYSAGSIFDRSELIAKRGFKGPVTLGSEKRDYQK